MRTVLVKPLTLAGSIELLLQHVVTTSYITNESRYTTKSLCMSLAFYTVRGNQIFNI